jgi:hypothetical protein
MQVVLFGGPYDGTTLYHNDINLYAHKWESFGVQKFLLLPPFQDWKAVRDGDLPKGGPYSGNLVVYEAYEVAGRFEGKLDVDAKAAEGGKEFRFSDFDWMPGKPMGIAEYYCDSQDELRSRLSDVID